MTRWGRAAAVVGALVALGIAAAWAVPLPARLATAPSSEVRWADGTTAHVFLSADEKWRLPVALDAVDPDYVAALLAIEDARFRWHVGVDPVAVARAVGQNLAAGEVRSGASTLTMQLARMLEPRPRTLRSKLVEALRAVQLELRYSKDELLALYLTYVPYGRNVEGVRAAAWWYFGHDAGDLSPAEIATLLAVPQDPNHRFPSPANRARLTAARDDLAGRLWGDGGALPADQPLAEVRATPAPARIAAVPRHLPHAAPWMRARAGGEAVRSTLDAGVQSLVARTLAAAHDGLEAQGIHNGAVVVIEHATGEVRALAAMDFEDHAHGGQIPAFDIPRSPGSALKPVLYADTIGRGLVLPETLVTDVPVAYRGYAPKNYDDRFTGLVRLEDALSRSLNVPFVNLLSRSGVEPFLALLRAGGAAHLDPRPGHYGLSAVVGGIELTPLELGGMYAALAGDGRWRPPRWRADGPVTPARAWLGEEAAWLTRRALRLRDRPDFPARATLAALPSRIHWKTGTSFGNRDAWAIGSGARHTVVVWLGNVDQRPSMHLVGADAAGPLLFDLLEGLRDGLAAEEPAPDGVRAIGVCPLSGALPGAACPEARPVPAPSRVPTDRCRLHVAVDVATDSGLALTPGCRDRHPHETRTFVAFPPEVQRWLGGDLRGLAVLPPLSPDCEAPTAAAAPVVRSPEAGQVAVLVPGVSPDEQEIPFEAETAAVGDLAWFVDGRFLARARSGERVWWTPEPGAHRVVVMDGAGRTSVVDLEVRGGH